MRALLVLALAGCSPAIPVAQPTLVASSRRLPPPPAIDPDVRGAAYLNAIAAQLQVRWAAFLEDCRLRLPADHPLNVATLRVGFDLAIGPTGAVVERAQIETSGNGDFDTAAADVLADAAPLPVPPRELMSDDDRVHVRWLFARDRRQAGPATARVVTVELPLARVIDGWLGRGELVRAIRRIVRTPAGVEREAAARRVMIAALREALASPDGAARRAAVEACGRAGVQELAEAVRAQLAATTDPELRLAAISAVGALGDRAAAPALLVALHDDLVHHSPIALARVAALAALGQAEEAATVVRAVLDTGPNATALAALAVAPVPAVSGKLAAWAIGGNPATRGAVCMALPMAAPGHATALIARGLGDPDATVRATCADAAARMDAAHLDAALLQRLRVLVRDRDRSVRARAVAAVARLDPAHPVRAIEDPAPEVRAAAASAASELELHALIADREPAVRSAGLTALAALGDRARDAALQAAGDPSAAVRWVAARVLDDTVALERLARDDSPEVATAALVRLAALQGRAAVTARLLEQLAAAPAGSTERARIALAWLLAS